MNDPLARPWRPCGICGGTINADIPEHSYAAGEPVSLIDPKTKNAREAWVHIYCIDNLEAARDRGAIVSGVARNGIKVSTQVYAELIGRISNPRQPNDALRALFTEIV